MGIPQADLILRHLTITMRFVKTGKIVDFHYPGLDEVEQLASHVTGFTVSHHRLEIYGTCQECAKRKSLMKKLTS